MDRDLTRGPIMASMLKFAVPMILGNLLQQCYNVADTLIVGKFLGSNALAAVGSAFTLMTFLTSVLLGLCMGSGAVFSIRFGRRDEQGLAESIRGSFVLIGTLTVLLNLAAFACLDGIRVFLQVPEEVWGYMREYLAVIFWGITATFLYNYIASFLRAVGNSVVPLVFLAASSVLNILLDLWFVLELGQGVAGAARATVISQLLSALWTVGFLVSKKSSLTIKREALKPEWPVIGRIMALGVSPFIMRATESLISIVLNSGLQRYGGDIYVGSLTIMQSVMQMYSAPIGGFTQGVQPIISYNFGAGNFDRVKKLYRRMIGICFAFSAGATALVIVFPRFFASLFTNDGELITLVGKMMPIFMCGMLVFGLQNGIQPTFLALGQAKISLFIAVFRKVILLVPLALILPLRFGVMGIYYAEPISDILSATVASVLFFTHIKKIVSKETLENIV